MYDSDTGRLTTRPPITIRFGLQPAKDWTSKTISYCSCLLGASLLDCIHVKLGEAFVFTADNTLATDLDTTVNIVFDKGAFC